MILNSRWCRWRTWACASALGFVGVVLSVVDAFVVVVDTVACVVGVTS